MRVKHATISFDMPQGFQDETSISIAKPLKTDKDGRPLDSNGYPLSITITRDVVGKAPGPVPYLQLKLQQLRGELQNFALNFVESVQVRSYLGAKAQFSFTAYFQLEQLVYVWFVGDVLMTATLSTTEAGVEEGWQVLTQVVESIDVENS